MGGNAFKNLPASAFPRIPPVVYFALKERLTTKLSQLFSLVTVPIEAPEKVDFGDLDFTVALPLKDAAVSPKDVQHLLGGTHAILMEGNRTSNYAVPIPHREWVSFGHGVEAAVQRARLLQDLSNHPATVVVDDDNASECRVQLFYQVDVHVCHDEAEWKRISFFNSHGDMGMILGLLLPDPPNPPLELSDNFDEILTFMGLSTHPPRSPFSTRRELFEWLASSRFFDPNKFRSSGSGISKVKIDRKLYHNFVLWAETQRTTLSAQGDIKLKSGDAIDICRLNHDGGIHDEALDFFKKRDVFEAAAKARLLRTTLRSVWRGHQVRDWAELGEHWSGVSRIMNGVREELGGDEKIAQILLTDGGQELLKTKVLETRDRLGLVPVTKLSTGL
ncbi:hypothetical protein ONZ45_g8561 [Pleurotus djamor]|nr:hypothetical protein ONZ45_g8561 [Pleurotus djamor]